MGLETAVLHHQDKGPFDRAEQRRSPGCYREKSCSSPGPSQHLKGAAGALQDGEAIMQELESEMQR